MCSIDKQFWVQIRLACADRKQIDNIATITQTAIITRAILHKYSLLVPLSFTSTMQIGTLSVFGQVCQETWRMNSSLQLSFHLLATERIN